MAATPESQVVTPTPPKKANGLSPAARLRLSAAMKAAHAKKPNWRAKTSSSKLNALEKRDAKIRAMIKAHPELSFRKIAERLKVHESRVYRVTELDGLKGSRTHGTRLQVAERRVKIRELLAQGLAMNEVARQLGIGHKAVQLARDTDPARLMSTHLRRGPGGRPSQAPEAIRVRGEKIQELLASGMAPSAIAVKLGLNPATVYYWKAKAAGHDYRAGEGRVRVQHADLPHAETYNWLRHAYKEIMKQVRERSYEPTIAEHYAILAYKTFGR